MSDSTSLTSSFYCVDIASNLYGKNTNRPFKSPSLLLNQGGRSLSVRRVQRVLEAEAPLIPPSSEQPYLKYSDIRMRQCNIRLLLAIVPVLSFCMGRLHTDAHWKIKHVKKLICIQRLILSQTPSC